MDKDNPKETIETELRWLANNRTWTSPSDLDAYKKRISRVVDILVRCPQLAATDDYWVADEFASPLHRLVMCKEASQSQLATVYKLAPRRLPAESHVVRHSLMDVIIPGLEELDFSDVLGNLGDSRNYAKLVAQVTRTGNRLRKLIMTRPFDFDDDDDDDGDWPRPRRRFRRDGNVGAIQGTTQMFQTLQGLQHVKLDFGCGPFRFTPEDADADDKRASCGKYMGSLVAGFKHRNLPLATLELSRFSVKDGAILLSMLASAARSVVLKDFFFEGIETWPSTTGEPLARSNLEVLRLEPKRGVPLDGLRAIIDHSSASLKRLFIFPYENRSRYDDDGYNTHDTPVTDITKLVEHLLRTGKHLQELVLSPYLPVNLSEICKLLEDNKSLRMLQVASSPNDDNSDDPTQLVAKILETKNDTLESFSLYDVGSDAELKNGYPVPVSKYTVSRHRSSRFGRKPQYSKTPQWEQIDYFTGLNRCGRKKARCNKTTMAELVTLLESAPKNLTHCDINCDVTSIYYGLLRENPGTWANETYQQPLKRPWYYSLLPQIFLPRANKR